MVPRVPTGLNLQLFGSIPCDIKMLLNFLPVFTLTFPSLLTLFLVPMSLVYRQCPVGMDVALILYLLSKLILR